MAKIVEITQSSDTVTCDENGVASIRFDVNNITSSQLRVGAKIIAEEPAKQSWFTLEGKSEKILNIDASDQFLVRIDAKNAPKDASYKFSLLVYSVENSDEDYTSSKVIAVKVPPQKIVPTESETKSNMWIVWLLIGVLVVSVAGVTAYVMLGGKEKPQADPVTPEVKNNTAPAPAPAETVHAKCPYGVNQCLPGYVWREAFQGDYVCVTGETRSQTASDNSQANARRNPQGGPYGPDTCLSGYVWREAKPDDHVCVTGETRTLAAYDNSQAHVRRDPNCAK